MHSTSKEQAWLPSLLYSDGKFLPDTAVVCDESGQIIRLAKASETPHAIPLKDKALLPGLVNTHSHAFQRVIRGRTEYRTQNSDSFWTWREQMYAAANKLSPDDIYVASRMAFMEMALAGITTVGEFHYIHNASDGAPYSDPNLLALKVVQAAVDSGLRIALLRVAYVRAGFQKEADPLQQRFIETAAETYLKNVDQLNASLKQTSEKTRVGIAPHSVRAVPLDYLKTIVAFANERKLPVHMHVAEQPAEVSACIEEYGRSPVALLDTEGLLSNRFTAVHAIHVTPKSINAFAKAGAMVCACPTTERNLGDGVVPVDQYFQHGVPVSLGSDSQIQIDLLEDARELEYHLRLQQTARNVLAPTGDHDRSALARRLFDCATVSGAASLGFAAADLKPGSPGDFFAVDLNDPSIAGSSADDLLANIVFSATRAAISDTFVAGKRIVESGRHFKQEETLVQFKELQDKLWNA